jgi:hypothetical protein
MYSWIKMYPHNLTPVVSVVSPSFAHFAPAAV